LQPWHFVAIGDPSVKHKIRVAAEEEERKFYEDRAPAAWLEALAPLGTDSRRPFLEIAPWLPVAAIHQAGLVALTHTPRPMAFLNRILARPTHEKPLLLLVVGHPAADARVPDIERKSQDAISTFKV